MSSDPGRDGAHAQDATQAMPVHDTTRFDARRDADAPRDRHDGPASTGHDGYDANAPYIDASGPPYGGWSAGGYQPYPYATGDARGAHAAGYGQGPWAYGVDGPGPGAPYAPGYLPPGGAWQGQTGPYFAGHHGPVHPGFVPGQMPYASGRIDPMTGEPLSDKSKVAAGLLQFFFGIFGVGRFYIGDNRIGGIQLALGLIGLFGTFILIGFPFLVGVSVWAFIDAILMLTGSVRDPYGRKLS